MPLIWLRTLLSLRAVIVSTIVLVATSWVAEARIVRIEITGTKPAFGGASFGDAGPYERMVGRAFGEVDPAAPGNAVIQDIELAPRNARGMVEYSTDIEVLRPSDAARGNGILLFNILNRGDKGALSLFNADVPPGLTGTNNLQSPGDGWLQRQGYTLIWFGWQADVLPGDGRMTFRVPSAHNPDGSPVTGIVRAELVVRSATTSTLSLASGYFTGMSHAGIPTVSRDNQTPLADGFLPVLTVRKSENAPRTVIPNTEWRFGECNAAGDASICLPAGFEPGRLYELLYKGKDPLVMGLGFAAAETSDNI